MRIISFCLLFLALANCIGQQPPPIPFAGQPPSVSLPPSAYVSPMIGTGGHGHTFPGPTLPFGMMQLSPDTRLDGWDGCSGYHNSDSVIFGFSHTHLSGTGVSDYGDVLIMPDTGLIQGPPDGYSSRFQKYSERASAGHYEVLLRDPDVFVELTSTLRAGLHAYSFLQGSNPKVLIDLRHRDPVLKSGIQFIGDRRVEGFRVSNAWAKEQHLYFALEFSQPFTKVRIEGAEGKMAKEGTDVVAQVQFAPTDSRLMVRIGISAVDVEGARRNLAAELPDFDFVSTLKAARAAWDKSLSKIEVEGGDMAQKRIFYTALYHTMTAPNIWSDVDGRYRAMDMTIATLPPGDAQYTVFSLWDTFRATHPLYTIIEQDRTAAFIRTFIRQAEHGLLPVWELAANETDCMIGYHSVSVIADAYQKGITNFDAQAAMRAMTTTANKNSFGLEAYRNKGMIEAQDEAESVSKTLEYAYDDWCIAQFAGATGNKEQQQEFMRRAQQYKNLYDPATGFFRARMNGGWMPGFDPSEVNFNFTEANAWQYSLFVPQDIGTLIDLHGGKQGFEKHLDALFSADSQTTGREQADITGLIGQYAHGNEPSHHMAYLYMYCGAEHKTQAMVRRIMQELYSAAPDGLSGNEDCGQMSAWLVMSAMGFYPVSPGSPNYIIGSPWFKSITLKLENGKTFRISAPNNQRNTPFVRRATLNGLPWHKPWLSHADIMKGGALVFEMSEKPGRKWFTETDAIPDLRIPSQGFVPMPYFEAPGQTFSDSMRMELRSANPADKILYSLDGKTPDGASGKLYEGPIVLRGDAQVIAVARAEDGRLSRPVSAQYFKIDGDRKMALESKYSNQYSAGGNNALIDRLRGGSNFRTGRWQGYQEDLKFTVDLGLSKDIHKVSVGFLQDIGSWIWMPKTVEVLVSEDGRTFRSVGLVNSPVSDKDYLAQTRDFEFAPQSALKARYVRIQATNYGTCPEWHLGAGGTTWIFADEVRID